jgi:hypothetical protein
MINVRRQKADLNAAKIAKNLTRIERVNIENGPGSGSRITHPLWIWTRRVSLQPIRTVQVAEYGLSRLPRKAYIKLLFAVCDGAALSVEVVSLDIDELGTPLLTMPTQHRRQDLD